MANLPVRIVIAGLGTVGMGVIRMLHRNQENIAARCGGNIEIVGICETDPRRRPPPEFADVPVSADAARFLDDPAVDIFVELIGGVGAAREYVLKALDCGKHVVTANKALLAQHWDEIFAVARRHGCGVRFEAAVMAGVPIIRGLHEGLAGNAITSITGILNGTTNFILTQMESRNLSFAEALEAARTRGLCERDASLDIDGHDATHKLSVLGSLAMGQWLPPQRIYTEGIRNIDHCDITYAAEQFGYRLKLLAIFKEHDGQIEARVHPTFVRNDHPLASVGDAFNAALIQADAAGPVMLYGLGAGEQPAASGVVSDIISLARAVTAGVRGPSLLPAGIRDGIATVRPMADVQCKFYLRIETLDRPGVLSAIAGALGRRQVSIASVYQRGRAATGSVPVLLVTHEAREGAVQEALKEIAAAEFTQSPPVLIRIEEPD